MAVIRYKGYSLPYNPRKLEMKYSRDIIKYPVVGGASLVYELASSPIIVNGYGSFFGSNAEYQFDQLAELYSQGGAGQLFLPNERIIDAYFVSLTQIYDSDILDYRFEFVSANKSDPKLVIK